MNKKEENKKEDNQEINIEEIAIDPEIIGNNALQLLSLFLTNVNLEDKKGEEQEGKLIIFLKDVFKSPEYWGIVLSDIFKNIVQQIYTFDQMNASARIVSVFLRELEQPTSDIENVGTFNSGENLN